jgi:multidrug efflux pump subunit AcrA (membrane-fusion protein)
VKRGNLRITLTEEGTLRAKDAVVIQPGIQRELVITYIVPNGTFVRKGERLVEFQKKGIQDELTRARLELQSAQNSLVIAQEEYKRQKLLNQWNIKNVEWELDIAQKNLKSFEELEGPRLLSEAKARLEMARIDAKLKQNDYDELKVMLKQDLVSERRVKEAEIAARDAQNRLESAEMGLKLIKEYTYPNELARCKIAVERQRSRLESIRSEANSLLVQRRSTLLRAESTLKERKRQVDRLQSEIQRLIQYAPRDGFALHGDHRQPKPLRRRAPDLEAGRRINGNAIVITIPDISVMRVDLQISEEDIPKIKVGQSTLITLSALPERILHGKVDHISSIGVESWWGRITGESSKFHVISTIDEQNPHLKPGMKCKVEIFVAEVKDVIFVPVHAVFEKEGKSYCYVLKDFQPVQTLIQIGRSNDYYVEVMKGLKEGQIVTLYDPTRGKG